MAEVDLLLDGNASWDFGIRPSGGIVACIFELNFQFLSVEMVSGFCI